MQAYVTGRVPRCPANNQAPNGGLKLLATGKQPVGEQLMEILSDVKEMRLHLFLERCGNAGMTISFHQPGESPPTFSDHLEMPRFRLMHRQLRTRQLQ